MDERANLLQDEVVKVRTDTVGRPMEILLVEDSLTSARLTMGVLKKGNVQHRMTWLTDGQDASDFLFCKGKYSHAPRPDLILLDLELPGKDGRTLLAELKSDEHLQRIPVVVLTGSQQAEENLKADKLSIEGFLPKPVDIERFLEVIRELNRFWHADMMLPT